MKDINTKEEYKAYKKQKHQEMLSKQYVPYSIKVAMAKDRIKWFIEECDRRGLNYHVSVGGLDSIVLGSLIRSMGYDAERVPFVSASTLEDASIQAVHKELGCIVVKPIKSKVKILQEEGFPVLSKRIANKINTIANPTERNKTVRHAIITGECGEQGHFATDSKMKLPQSYLELFGGLDAEGRELGYKAPTNFKVSHMCCYYLKEKPCDDWAKEHNSVPFLGLMASEGGQRADALEENGCNYFGKTTARSCPFAFFFHSDVIHLALDLGVHIPEIYGEVKIDGKTEMGDDNYITTGEQRTGCSMCGFGIQLETRPHRFDRLYERNPQEWDFWMHKCCTDEDGVKYGWGRVLDYIGIPWRDPEHWYLAPSLEGQMTIFDFPEYCPKE